MALVALDPLDTLGPLGCVAGRPRAACGRAARGARRRDRGTDGGAARLAPGARRRHPAPAGTARCARPAAASRGGRQARRRHAVVAPGPGHRPGPCRPFGGGGHGHRVGQVAVLPGAAGRGGRRRCGGARRCWCSPPRRWRTTSCVRWPRRYPGVVAGAYDGDTGNEERAWIRRHATAVLTNPEMLHSGILPHHDRWATFLGRLRYVVVDELHAFPGHIRLARRPPAAAAAPAGQPLRRRPHVRVRLGHHRPARAAGQRLCGVPVEPVVDDGSPQGERLVAGGTHRPSTRPPAPGCRPTARRRVGGRAGALGAEDHRLLPQPAHHRGGGGRRAAAPAVAPAAGSRPTGAATSPTSAAPSRTTCSAGGSTGWSPPARSSWASTWGASTPWC